MPLSHLVIEIGTSGYAGCIENGLMANRFIETELEGIL